MDATLFQVYECLLPNLIMDLLLSDCELEAFLMPVGLTAPSLIALTDAFRSSRVAAGWEEFSRIFKVFILFSGSEKKEKKS